MENMLNLCDIWSLTIGWVTMSFVTKSESSSVPILITSIAYTAIYVFKFVIQ